MPDVTTINAVAPIRVCDLGGWTDTWFAEKGTILNIGVYPYAEVQVYARKSRPEGDRGITINAVNFGDRYAIPREQREFDRHPLLEAAISSVDLPDSIDIEVNIYSEAPAGASTGTSAAVTVALLGALDLLTPGHLTPHEVASLAQRVETEKLGLQCGIQDQLCSAYGGLCFIEMFQYPHAWVSPIALPNATWWELERRLVLVYLGSAHSSSQVHEQVIRRLEAPDADKGVLRDLAQAARDGKDALFMSDFGAFGQIMNRNTELQRELHPELVSAGATEIMEIAKRHGAEGCKVNGAGGAGGSITICCGPDNESKRSIIRDIEAASEYYQVIPTYLSRMGLRRWIQGQPLSG